MSSAPTQAPPVPPAASAASAASAAAAVDPKIARRLAGVRNVILVLSGKGGVGKSSVAAQLALSLSCLPPPKASTTTDPTDAHSTSASQPRGSSSSSSHGGARRSRVGVLDVDLTGPSMPRMLGLDGQSVRQSSDGWVPVYADREQSLAVMSVGFLLRSRNDSVVWRGPKKNAMIKQFLGDVRWGELDWLVIDTPPGTSDEHISLMEYLAPFSPKAVLVTTPQAVSLADNLRSLDFCRKTSLPLLGLIENLSGYVCPHCRDCTNVWGKGGGEALANREKIRFLGRIPIDPGLVRVLDDAREEVEAVAATDDDASAPSSVSAQPPPPAAAAAGAAPQASASSTAAPSVPPPTPPTKSTTTTDGDAALSTAPQGTRLSRTVLARYRDSQTFPIFEEVTQRLVGAVEGRSWKVL